MEIVPQRMPRREHREEQERVREYHWTYQGKPGWVARVILIAAALGVMGIFLLAFFWLGVVALVLGGVGMLAHGLRGMLGKSGR